MIYATYLTEVRPGLAHRLYRIRRGARHGARQEPPGPGSQLYEKAAVAIPGDAMERLDVELAKAQLGAG